MARPFAVVGFTALFTLALLFFLPEWAVYLALAPAASGFVLSLILRKPGSSPVIPAALASAALACVLLLTQLALGYHPALQATGENLEIHARIESNAQAKYGRYYYRLRILTIDGKAARLIMRLSSPYAIDCEPYDEIAYTGAVMPLGRDDPEMTDYYKAQGVWLGTYATSYSEDRFEVAPGHGFHPMKPILRMQRAIARSLDLAYSDSVSGLLRGMLLGDVSGLSWTVREDFRQSGTSHIFSVSGLHMSLLAWSVFRLLRALKCPRKASALLAGAFVVFFMALTGFSAPCVRSGVMMLLLLAGELSSRRADSLNSLGLAALVLALASPLSAGQVGLELSFGATLGMVLFQGRFSAPLKRRFARLPKLPRKIANFLNESTCVTLSALALTAPILWLRMPGGLSLATLPANLALVPLSSLLMILGGVSALLPEPLRAWLAFVTEPLGRLTLKTAQVMADLPAPVIWGSLKTLAIPLAVCLLIAAFALLRRYAGKPVPLWITSLACVLVILLGGWLPGLAQSGRTVITRLETGQGMSVLVSRGRKAALLGCDGDELPGGAAKGALSAMGARGLELLLIPGNDAGAAEILRDVPVRQVIEAEGVTRFSLWDGTDGIFYRQGDIAACLIRTESELVLIQFSGETPAEWREVARLGPD
ncbi:MAG: ComEC/Rec2 family competence protein [Firmicutes bacterium]|nr:ComEC/Rec2 family competence protein [Bacillota bacterium]